MASRQKKNEEGGEEGEQSIIDSIEIGKTRKFSQ